MVEKAQLLTNADFTSTFGPFRNDRDRIKYMSKAYKKMNLAKAFAVFYGMELPETLTKNYNINRVVEIELGGTYTGTVLNFDEDELTLTIPGVKEEIISLDNFNNCKDAVDNYLLTHNNQLLFEVREKRNGKYYVSVLNAYYNSWRSRIETAITRKEAIDVHIDSLTTGGYLCHTTINDLYALTGKEYTSSVFIPGSNIVLNIERDFERWIGETVTVIPQRLGKTVVQQPTSEEGYRGPRIVEDSIICSRKAALQIKGMVNIHEIYQRYAMGQKEGITYVPETFTGTITGVINSNKKVGFFVEIDGKYITGLAPTEASNLLNYKPGDKVTIRIKEFEVQEGREPFEYNRKNSTIKHCNVRPVFEIAG